MSVTVCLSVLSHISETTDSNFTKVFYMLPMAVTRSSSGGAAMLCTSVL